MKHIVLHSPTAQQVVDAVFGHLAGMDAPCRIAGHCAYRNDTNTSACAIGVFIPDGHEALQVQGTVGYLLRRFPRGFAHELPTWMYKHKDLLHMLQGIHDWGAMTPVARKFFAQHGLVVPPITTGFLA